jgi:hypothetical protein
VFGLPVLITAVVIGGITEATKRGAVTLTKGKKLPDLVSRLGLVFGQRLLPYILGILAWHLMPFAYTEAAIKVGLYAPGWGFMVCLFSSALADWTYALVKAWIKARTSKAKTPPLPPPSVSDTIDD